MLRLTIILVLLGLSQAFEELRGVVKEEFLTDRELEAGVEQSIRKGRYDILLELRIRDALERSKTDAQRAYYAYLLIKYTQDLELLKLYGKYINPDNLIRLCRDELRAKSPVERYKECFEVHKDGRFFRGIYAVMNLRDTSTRRWMENKLIEVKLYKDYAYHSLGLLYYQLGDERRAISSFLSAGRLGLLPLIKIYINRGDYQRAREYAQRLRSFKDLSPEEREVLQLVDTLSR